MLENIELPKNDKPKSHSSAAQIPPTVGKKTIENDKTSKT